MDLRDSAVDRERALLSFYKMAHVEWACPLTCTLKGKLLTHTKLKIKDMFFFFFIFIYLMSVPCVLLFQEIQQLVMV